MGFVINGASEVVPRLPCASWFDDRTVLRLREALRVRPRTTRWIRGIVIHAPRAGEGGTGQEVRPGRGAAAAREWRALQSRAEEAPSSGAHLLVDHDGSIVCAADLLAESACHAGAVNEVTIGVEIHRGDQGEVYAEQLAAVARLIDWLTLRFRIQRQIPHQYGGRPIARLALGGRGVVGVYGHRDVTGRDAGDPGDEIFRLLAEAGYERRDFERGEDLVVWRSRQSALARQTGATLDVDGVPGPGTCAALRAAGRAAGLWVARPGD